MAVEHQLGSARGAFAITAGASPLSRPIRGLYVGGTGNVVVTMESGESVTLNSLAEGLIHPIRATHVTAAGGATGILGFY
jgi:hypothetical protein